MATNTKLTFLPTSAADTNPEIEVLQLALTARNAAYELKKAHPSIKFTSGRRSIQDQAHAMAGNVVKSRNWIKDTYIESTLSIKCQNWINDHPNRMAQSEIAEGLLLVLSTATTDELNKFSKHLSGEAFDVQPVDNPIDAEKIKNTIRHLSGLKKFLEKEGGLVRWHAQF